jgi:hypothetical protein
MDSHSPYPHLSAPSSVVQRLTGVGPVAGYESHFVARDDGSFKEVMLFGYQEMLALTYLFLFACLEMATGSPGIGAFVVLVLDFFVVKMFKWKARNALRRVGICLDRSLIG